MDMATCVARRTRSRTESYLNSILNQAKGLNQPHEGSSAKRASMRETRSPSPVKSKRRRKKVSEDDDIEFIETRYPQGMSPPLQVPKSQNRVCDFAVGDVNLRDEGNSTSPDDVVYVGSISPHKETVEDDDNVGSSSESSSDNTEESSDSSYMESDEVAKVRKSPSRNLHGLVKRKNDVDVFELLTKSIWQRTKLSEEDMGETTNVHIREDVTVRECPSEKIHEQRIPRSYHREKKEKNHSNVSDLLGNLFCDGGGNPWDEQETINLRFGCEEPEPVEETEEEREIIRLWEDMALALRLEGLQSSYPAEENGHESCISCTHDFILDEEIGLKCCYCSYVFVKIRDISPAMDKYHANVYDKKTYNEKKGNTLLNGLEFEGSDHRNSVNSLKDSEGTVWEYIPGVKDTLYPHQQEGFEFIWKNLAGTTKLDELNKSSGGIRESGGCIISHEPGTGKTRLTIVFLQSYLERFPDCHPVVIAPASVLLTWEEEFKKWNANIPFYNLNSLEFSGHEDQSAVSLLKGIRSNKRSVRMVKLYSWRNKKSVLGISYSLYEKLAGNKRPGETQEFRRMLLELPGLLVLDEGHTPRNQSSYIWKALSEVRTEKRIILSGTPFQNNFKELSNVLCLTRPAYTDWISSRLQDLTKWSQEHNNQRFYEETGIVELKAMIAPFVHVHKENVLGKSLPGLRDCVVVLNPTDQQQKILAGIDPLQKTFELEHKRSAVSVHPSLYLHCNPTTKELFSIGPAESKSLKKIRLNSEEGVKTRFLINFIRLSQVVKEKVLVFSQYIETLKLIRDQLSAVFGWTEGEETLLMYGKVEQKDRKHLINNFNNPDSKSKVLLASTRACSEGIHLVGASRVVILDVVWNPSVERQAISRAYRTGQKRVVYAYHLMVKGTYEWDKYCKQTNKHRISELVFSSTIEKDKLINNEAVSEDRILDEMVRHEKQKDMFEKILYHPKKSVCLPTSSD